MKRLMIILMVSMMSSLAVQAQQRLVTIDATPVDFQNLLPVASSARLSAQQSAPVRRALQQPRRKPRLAAASGLSSVQRAVGYCPGDSVTYDSVYIGTAGTYPVAAMLLPDKLADYVGCKVVGIRYAVCQSMMKSRVFLYKLQNSRYTDTPQIEQSSRFVQPGWNNVFFNGTKDFTISANDTILFGFDYLETAAMASSEKGGLCTYMPQNDDDYAFFIYGPFGQSGESAFFTVSSVGDLCVQLIVDVSNKPLYDVDMSSLLFGNKYKKAGETVDLFAVYRNVGRDSVRSARIGYQIDNGTPGYVASRDAVSEGESGSAQVSFKLPADISVGPHYLTVFVDQLEGAAPTTHKNDTIREKFFVYENGLARQQHYIEQYTSQLSYLAPFVDIQMSDSLRKDKNLCVVNVFRAGDDLAIDGTGYLERLYAYTYPCFTVDRLYFFGEQYIAFDVNYYAMLMPDLVQQSVRMLASEADQNPAFATVNITPTYNSVTRQLSLDVSGQVSPDAQKLFGDLALTVLLTEDSVVARQRYYDMKSEDLAENDNYMHHQVLRRILTAPVGNLLTPSGNSYKSSFSTTLDLNWKPGAMKVVAFVTRAAKEVTRANVFDMDITNANSCTLFSPSTGISRPQTTDGQVATAYYTLDGIRVAESQLRNGVYIMKQGSEYKKVVVKK